MKSAMCGLVLGSFVLAGCLPTILQKYRPGAKAPVAPQAATGKSGKKEKPPAARRALPKLEKIGKHSYGYNKPHGLVWQSAVEVLLSHYNITALDKKSGLLTTEWDSFYLNGDVFRNKVSLSVTPAKNWGSQVKIYNNLEKLTKRDGVPVWLPAERGEVEAVRIAKAIRRDLEKRVLEN